MRRLKILLSLLLALPVLGCAATHGVSVDPDHPKQVCVDTMEGTAGKSVCY
jgi:hypothetical protein